jgi:flagellar biosynthesis/type III secretory pathway M-ring protein FliF/YscJ
VVPWLIFALILVPVLVVAFVVARRRTAAGEHPAGETTEDRAEMEKEFADAEAYQAEHRKEERAQYDEEERFF